MIALKPRRLDEAAQLGLALIEGVPGAGLLVLDRDLRILRADGDVHEQRDRAAIIGRKVVDVIPAGAWARLEPYYTRVLAGAVQSVQHDASGDGSVHRLRLAPIREDDVVVGVVVLSEDITTKVAAVRELATSEGLQRSVLDVLDEGVIVIDADRRLVQANPTACAVLGLDLEAARAEPEWWRAVRPRRAGGTEELDVFTTVVASGQGIRDVDVEADGPDGQTIRLSVNYQPLRDQSGATSGMVMSFRDVTERVREFRRVAEGEERLRDAHEVAQLSSWEWDPESDELTVFRALADEDGIGDGSRISFEEALANTPQGERQGARDDLAALASGERDATVRRTYRRNADGDSWVETRTRAVRDEKGALRYVRGTTQDVTEQELARQEATQGRDFLQATLDSLPSHIAVLNSRGEILMTNRAWVEFAAANDGPATSLRQNYLEVCEAAKGDEWAAAAAAGVGAVMSGEKQTFSLEYPCHSPGEDRWFVLRAAHFAGAGSASVVVAHDEVTKRREAEDQVATQAELLDEVDVAVIATGLDGRITHWNRGAKRLLGWGAFEVVGRGATELIAAPGDDGTDEFAGELRRAGQSEGEFTVRRKDGSTLPVFARGRARRDATGEAIGRIGVLVDMTERTASESALRAATAFMEAVTDGMGEGLFTLDTEGRVSYMNKAAEKLLGWPLADLEGRVMHPITHPRRADGSVFPADDCPIGRAQRDGETIRVRDDVFVRQDGRKMPVAYTASPFETHDGVQGCVVVFGDITERKAREGDLQLEVEKLVWIERIHQALAEDRFVLYAQPIVELESGRTVQRELLLRLREPDGEIIPPGAFLGIAEEYGLIGEIDRWVIERGCELVGAGSPVEINLSAQSLGDPDVLAHIEQALKHAGADPSLIVFELTETAIVEDLEEARVFMERLHELGCKLALDDFGTGYGGFTYLKQLPLDYLKIDIEFVRDLAQDPASRHVVEAVVALARGFELQTVAEGVEDAATLELLRELGVDFAQGYHIARPGPLEPTETQEETK